MQADDKGNSTGGVPDECPTDDDLRRFLAGRLSPDREAVCGRHLDSCPECQRRAEEVTHRSVWSTEFEWLSPASAELDLSGSGLQREPTLFLTPPTSDQAATVTRSGVSQVDPVEGAADGTSNGLIPRWRELEQRFEIRETVGIGGCGTVFRAWDRNLHRLVALKVPHWPLFAHAGIRQRFAIEARAAARLSHPNIVPIFEAQIDEEVCFLASEFVEGQSLAAWLAERRTSQRPITCCLAAALVRELALGVEVAHSQGILHRDLKPANVLLDSSRRQDELPFIPRITDFGLARLSEEAGPTTVEGSVIGSLPYMSPEQAAGSGKHLDAGCDIYPLGVILYEALTGRLPILGTSPADLLQKIASQFPVEPRRLRPEIPADLQAICLKCLEKRPQDRYLTARELAADLSRFLAGETVVARSPSMPEQLIRWVRRHPTATTVVAVNFVALTAVAIVLAVANRQLTSLNQDLEAAVELQRAAVRRADELRAVSDAQTTSAFEKLYVAQVRRASNAWRDRDLPELELIVDRLAQPEFESFRSLEWAWLTSLLDIPYREVTRLPEAVYAVSTSSSGDVLAVTGKDAIVRLVDFSSGTTVTEWPTEQRECNDLLFTDHDYALWTTGDDGSLCQWEVATGRLLVRLEGHAPEQAHNLLAVPEDDLLISSGTDGKIRYWDLKTGAAGRVIDAHGRAVIGMQLLPDRRRLFSLGLDDHASTWNLTSGRQESSWDLSGESLKGFALSGDGRRLIATKSNRCVGLFDIASQLKMAEAQLLDVIDCLIAGSDSRTFYAADRQGVIHTIPDDPAAFRYIADYLAESRDSGGVASLARVHSDRIFDLQLTADGTELVSAGADGRVRATPVATLTPARGTFRASVGVTGFCSLPFRRQTVFYDGSKLGQFDERLNVLTTESPLPQPVAGADTFDELTVTRSGRVVTADVDQSREHNWLVIRDSDHLQPLQVRSFDFAPAGVDGIHINSAETLAVVRRHSWNRLQFIELTTGDEQAEMVFDENLSDSAMSPRSDLLAVSAGHRVVVFDPQSRQTRWSDDSLTQSIKDLTFSEDGKHLAAACSDRVVWIWEADSGKLLPRLTGHRQGVNAVAFSPDGRTLISGDSSGLIKFWRLETGDQLCDLKLDLPGGACAGLQFHATAETLLIRDGQGTLTALPLRQPAGN